MGVVYRALDTLLQRIVAVKVISAPIDQNPSFASGSFARPGRRQAVAQEHHHDPRPRRARGPAVPRHGVPRPGRTCSARMAAPQRMSLRRKVEVATEICEGLEFAHAHGVVHRDIKPGNIFITDSGTVKIVDFGLARLVTSELTRSNMMMGTINYMAPEQIRGERVDHRADIFSTGVVLYELLSGRRAFEGDSFASTLYKILRGSAGAAAEHRPGAAARGRADRRARAGQAARRAVPAHERDVPRSGRLPAAACRARFPGCQPSGNLTGRSRRRSAPTVQAPCTSSGGNASAPATAPTMGVSGPHGPAVPQHCSRSRRSTRARNRGRRDLDDDSPAADIRGARGSRRPMCRPSHRSAT